MYTDRVIQSKLDNGLTVLVCPKKDAEKVSIQLWYNVGSKHEKNGERGIAHFIEHMIFKGTAKLAESDINLVVSKLSGSCNAFTSYDYTGYLFDIPVANWDKVLPVMADCMENCTFKQEHLNSELKAVIQELKMYKDNYSRSLSEAMVVNMFESHPYHYPIIGYKQDLWSVTRETLLSFYKKYYTPDNAVMIIVGDVDPAEVHEKVRKEFTHIPAGKGWNQEEFYINEEVQGKTIKLFRDLKQPVCTVAFLVPGSITRNKFTLESFAYVLANGRGSRLYKLLVDQLQLVVSIHAYCYDLFERGVFFIEFNPKQEKDIQEIVQYIQKEIDVIAQQGPSLKEAQRAERFAQIDYQEMLEDTERQAYAIGEAYLALKDPLYPFHYGDVATENLMQDMQNLASQHLRSSLRCEGHVLAIPQEDKQLLAQLQELSDREDARILDGKQRETQVEGGQYVHTIKLNEKKIVKRDEPQVAKLDNGLELISLHSNAVETVEIQLELKSNHYFEPKELAGISNLVSRLMLEGTKNYPGQEFSDAIESYGMSFSVSPGMITTTVLRQDVEQGLSFLGEILTNALFTQQALDKVKGQLYIQLKKFWDTPNSFSVQLARQAVYKDHPYSKMILGTQEGVEKITLQDCINYYKKVISPQGARLSIVGNLEGVDIQSLVKKTIENWQGETIQDLESPSLVSVQKEEIKSYINRDQVVLVYAGLSVNRTHEDYDKIILFNQILTGGTLGSMSSRLFQLREQSGLFYTIGGSIAYGATTEPGMIMIKTIVSGDKVTQADAAILHELDTAIDTVLEDELQEAKNGLIASFDGLYETNAQKASTYLFLKKYNLPFNYFEDRIKNLQKITIADIQKAVKNIVASQKLVRIKVGRV